MSRQAPEIYLQLCFKMPNGLEKSKYSTLSTSTKEEEYTLNAAMYTK